MNRVFRIVWSQTLSAWVVASELAGRHGKGRGRAVQDGADERSLSRRIAESRAMRLGVLAALAAMYAPGALAVDRYWDVNGGSAGSGGTGTWNTVSPYWNAAGDGVAGPFFAWNNAGLDNAVFAGTAGTVTLGAPVTANALTFNTVGYTLTGGTLTLAGTTPTITGAGAISSVIAGTAGLTKAGTGTLTLSGANTFSGGINVNGSSLVVNGDAALGAASNGVTMAAGTGLGASSALASTRVVSLTGGTVSLTGPGVGSARFTGTANLNVGGNVIMSNAASDYDGVTAFRGGGSYGFTSIGNLGEASSLGAPTSDANGLVSVAAGGGLGGSLYYTGDGDVSNRDFQFGNTSSGGTALRNTGTGTLVLSGDMTMSGSWTLGHSFVAQSADLQILGVISSPNSTRTIGYAGGAGRSIVLGGANTYSGPSTINTITVYAPVLADAGSSSSFGTGTDGNLNLQNGTLRYTGGATSSNRTITSDGANTFANDGTGGVSLTGQVAFVAGGTDTLNLSGTYAGTNTVSGVFSGTGNLVANGSGNWLLSGANTYTGTTTVQAGTLTAGSVDAFGASKGLIVNGGTLDLNGLAISAPSLSGTGGVVQLGSGLLTLNASAGSTSYGGTIAGTGGLTKLGAGTQTLYGTHTYSGATTIGGGTLALDFAGSPSTDIISNASTLNLAGGTLAVKGTGAANTQTFNGLNVTAGNNRINASAGTGGSLTVALGAITRGGGLVDFGYNTGATITTTQPDGALGGWATVNGSDYAQVAGGVITAFTAYADKDDAGQWLNGDIVSDEGGAANTPYFGTVNGNVALGGLKYTAAAPSTVNVGTGNTLGVDGSIILSPTLGTTTQTIQGGSLTGGAGGSPLGVLQNSGGTFNIRSTIVDNGGATSFILGGSGAGTVALSGANTYTGGNTVSGGTLSFNSIADGGAASAIGASGNASSNLVLENGTLRYTGATASSDRGFTLVNGGPSRTIQVDGSADLTFGGAVTSPDDAGFTKTGTGTLTLSNGANDFIGPVTVSNGLLSTGTLANGGTASGIGAATSDPANLVLQTGGGLQYTGATTSTDRGFTLAGGQGHVDVSQAATTLTDSGTVVGGGTLVKDGAGILVLSGANTYTGGSTVTAGTLQAGSATAFGGSGPVTVNAGATLDASTFKVTIGGLNGAGNVTLGTGGGLVINGNGTFSGAIGGPGSVTVVGHSEVMNGCGSSYTGATTLSSATISTDCLANGGQASGIGASGSAPANLTLSSGTLIYTGGSVAIDRGIQLTGNGALSVSNAATTLGIGGTIQGTGQMQKLGSGTVEFGGTNTYTGGTYVRAGILRAGATNAFGTGYATLDDTAGAALDLNGFNTGVSYINGGGTTGGNIDLGSATLTITNGALNFAGAISGTGNLVKNGGGTQLLSGSASTYTGTTTVNAGQLQVYELADGGATSSIGSSGSAAGNLVLNGGTLAYVGAGDATNRLLTLGPSTTSALDASGTGAVQFTSTGALAFSGANTSQTVTLTGTSAANNGLALQIADNGTGKTSMRKTGTGTWILRNPASTYTGVTTITGGVLGVDKLGNGGQASSIGQSSGAAANLVIGSGATLRYTGTGDTTDRLFTLSTGASVIESSGTGAIVFSNTGSAAYAGNGNRTLGLGGSNTGLNAMGGSIIDGPGGVTTVAKNDAGTWALTGNNTYTGNTVVNGGILQIGAGGTTGSIASPSVIVAAGTLAFDRSDTMTLAGTVSGAGNVVQQGTGTTVFTAANTYTGGSTISAGTLQLGNGGANGSIVGNVTDNGTLAFNRSDVYTFGGLIGGTGGVTQLGGGTTVLTAANTYAGATNVQAGTLLINGDQAAATGTTTVQSGGTLGGKGVIGGNVTVESGGALSPGDAGAAGTLTIDGNLNLASGAALNYQFGQANTVGGALNDLTVVHGNLTLDGTINVAATPGGSFGPGLYRIVSYDGALTDNGLALDTAPAGTFQVQTSIAHQVNLLNTGGLTLNFWDGPSGHANNTIDGGTGVWQNSSGNDNWADQTGQYNAPYSDGEFGIFMGTPGTVTVDNSLGAVTSSGMQFAVSGYTIAGGPLTFSGAPNIVRVGDGTAAGAAMTATIAASLTGTGGLVKEDLGTLVLSGSNTYAGGTSVNDGTLEVSSDANLGDASGALAFDGGTLRNTAALSSARAVTINQQGATLDTQAALVLSGTIGGAGGLTKIGAASLTLDGNNSYAGGTAIDGGSIVVSSDGNLGDASGALTFDGGVLENTAGFVSSRTITLNGAGGRLLTDADLTLNGAIGGAGTLTKDGGGALVLTANNSYTGSTLIQAGTLQLGNGGSGGAILGAVTNNGTLVFNRSDNLAFAGLITGVGALEQQGSGITVLGADNSYAGPTAVRAGSLFVNGDQSLATGDTSVDAGGTLGGKGTIGGNVLLADGATLSPGDLGVAPGTLTVKGSMAMSDASNLDVSFGQANVVGGPLNDLLRVNGDLTLDGTVDVSVSAGGTFDPGIYRIIGYDGALIDNGMSIGTVPTPNYFLQTSIAQQVNLVNTAGLDVSFWDGNGARGDSQVQGGDGVWQNAGGNDNWTLIDGSVNAPYQDSSFAIFGGAGGTVTVDDTLGAVNSGGMQFAVGGYRLQGDSIALAATPTIIRVGDGTTAGTGMFATIQSVLTGTGGMTKSDLGTLVLAGDNTYTGGTTITGGALQIGEGGTNGSILGDVTDNGVLAFNRSDAQTFGGMVSGTGALMQVGSGALTLTGANTYTGETIAQTGTLLVNGDQSAATGATTVRSSGTLGGTGTIGGDVRVGDGGTLSPGDAGAAGTLTINGNLAFAGTSRLDYQFGQAGTVGGALNDLTVVHGNLTLDGTLDVAPTAGGSFGAGVYRLFSYDGSLTDNGLALGTVPTADAFVQTSIAHQVNLVNSAGLTLSFWDGPGHANDGAIAGGTGTWRLDDNDFWADASGSLNAPYSHGAFAVFGGAGGTVSVDNANGQVSASGLQFQTDGYRLTGGTLALAGGASAIRVGDGTAAGASMTATIETALIGSGMLVKDDLGTLVLTGTNVYAGGTEVRAGTLQVASDGNLGLDSGALSIDNATLHTTGSFITQRTVGLGGDATVDTDTGTHLEFTGMVSGPGSLTKTGGGTLTLSGSSTYSGGTTVAGGTLLAGTEGAFNASLAFTVQGEGTLDLDGHSQRVASLDNAGNVALGNDPGTVLTVAGNYTGQGGTLNVDAALGGDDSVTDRLVVTGNTAGNTVVRVTNVGGAGAPTRQGIKLIDVQGASNGSFALKGDYVFQGQQAVVAGAYAYRLYKDGVDSPDGDWYLRSALTAGASAGGEPPDADPPQPLYQPGVPLYEAYAGVLQQLNTLDTLAERVGHRLWATAQDAGDMKPGEGVWMRVSGGDRTLHPESSTSGANYDVSSRKAEAGIDTTVTENEGGRLVAGATLQYGRNHSDVRSLYGQGRLETDTYGIGASLTWYGDRGFYVDGQARGMRFDTDLRSGTLGQSLKDGNKGYGYVAGVEVGQRIGLGDHLWAIPQAQFSYGNARFDAFNDSFGARVSQREGKAITVRGGLAIDYQHAWQAASGPMATHVYAIANVYRHATDDARVKVAGTDFSTRNERNWGGFGLGTTLDWAGGRYSVYGEVQASTGLSHFGDSHALNGSLGFRMRW
ncbi:autotransporter-associated beta strand repeat-containing protein [Luteibacter sp. SG786]|uniref:autotransporter-associated beta strand repeat-containing protein n=1 Tax=Luteibacter sp. SG786 TaxID=2587130 RepID=UPI00141ECEC5|nr:autotransporter-associated beta strand repeat-containing protein [Luteibacter sp. SG786]NII55029.1 fibronectin-binding autotransporter adhesin [Luteibacter sp. SG786]